MAFLYTLLADLKLMSVDMLIIDEKPQISLQRFVFFCSQDRKSDVGTNLFIGNLDPDVDEKIVYDTFSTFGGTASNPMHQPVFMFANQAGLDMIETTLVALQDIALEKIFDESGICMLAFRNLYNGGHVTYEQAITWKVSDNDNSNNLHCLAFSFVNWSFV
ncbi:unnamed protein product [Brassica oleracea var. botrytis]